MSTDHAATVRHLYDMITSGDLEQFAGHLADDFVEHEETPGFAPTKDGVIAFFQMQRAAFPDMVMLVEDVLAVDGKAAARVRVTGTHRGPFMGLPATGKSVEVNLIDMFAFDESGRVREHWGVMDQLALMQQLGMVPAGAPA